MIKVLMQNQRKMLVNTIRTQRGKNLAGSILGMAVLAILLYLFSKLVWSNSTSITTPVLEALLAYGFLILLGFIVLLGVPQVFKHLYSGRDLELLFTMPISTKHIFWMKYMQGFIGIPLLAFVFFVIPLFIYGMATGVSLMFYPVVVLILLAVTIIGLSIAYLFNLVLIQIVPASRANEFMTVMSVLSGIFIYLLFMLPTMINDKPITELVLAGLPLLPKWVPTSWGSTAIIEAANGSIGSLLPLTLLILLAMISVLLATSLVERGFRTGWIRLSEGSSKKKKKRKKSTTHKRQHPIIAVGKKEWFSIKRDIREWLVFMPLAFFFIFGMVGFLTSGGSLSDMQGHHTISWPIAQGVLLFIYSISNGTVAASSVGREGASLWILRTLPLTGKQIAYGKFWISWVLPFIVLTCIEAIVGLLLGWTIIQFVAGVLIKAVITVGISAIGLWLGTIGAKYHPTNPQARLNFGVSILLFVSSYIYLFIALIPVGYLVIPVGEIELPPGLDHGMTGFAGFMGSIALKLLSLKISHPVIMGIAALIVLLIFSIGIARLCLYLSARKIDKGITIDIVSETRSKPLFGGKKPGGSLY